MKNLNPKLKKADEVTAKVVAFKKGIKGYIQERAIDGKAEEFKAAVAAGKVGKCQVLGKTLSNTHYTIVLVDGKEFKVCAAVFDRLKKLA